MSGLAGAGLRRLGLRSHITEILDRPWMLPAVGQGALGLECRTADDTTRALLTHLDDAATRAAVLCERAFLRRLGGGCLVPIGALAEVAGGTLTLSGAVLNAEGTASVTGSRRGGADDPEGVGHALADELIGRGAGELLRR